MILCQYHTRLGRLALDMIDMRAEGKYILVVIDYFLEELKRLYCRSKRQVK